MSFTVQWTIPPEAELLPNLDLTNQKVIEGLGQIGEMFAAKMESEAKSNAPWSDRTGNARQGLRGEVLTEALAVTIFLIHSVEYGVYLELGTSKMSPRPIIMPTLEANYAGIMAAARALVS